MIRTFGDRHTERIWMQKYVKMIPHEVQDIGLRKLFMINHAKSIVDLSVPPGNRLEKLSGNRIGQWSIRINNQYRIVFRWENNDAYDVQIIDYH